MNYVSQSKYQIKEIEDLAWFPSFLRNFQTDFIGFVAGQFNIYGPFIRYISEHCLALQPMFDLCSGSGEPALTIFKGSNCFNHLILSDKYPPVKIFNDHRIYYRGEAIDVREMEFAPGFCYTMFNAFHHFTENEKLKIVCKIKQTKGTGFFVEILEPGVFCFLKVLSLTTIGTLLLTPFIRPFSFGRLFFTYVIPVNVFTILFDGIVSVYKSRSVTYYKELFGKYKEVSVFKLRSDLTSLIVIQISPVK
jgi:hypothetical protein